MSFDVSIIATVYNKAEYLPATIQSLLNQLENNDLKIEIILVDDNSTDDSVKIIQENIKDNKDVSLITNKENKGPSIRVNQTAEKAKGKYLHFIDGDDIMPKNCTNALFKIMEKTTADFLYGEYEKTKTTGDKLLDKKIKDGKMTYTASNSPLHIIQTGGFARMNLMTTKDCFEKAGGCDSLVFIQDESLPIRLAAHAKKAIKLKEIIAYVPKTKDDNLSNNKPQQNHDRFFSYYNFWHQSPKEAKAIENYVYRKMVGSYWKYLRDHSMYNALSTKAFWWYLNSKAPTAKFNKLIVDQIHHFFKNVEDVRRI
ncbi:MAG: glycosyltransferase family 2 protein [Rickettsiales bacterium]